MFFITFKGVLLIQIKTILVEGESPTLMRGIYCHVKQYQKLHFKKHI